MKSKHIGMQEFASLCDEIRVEDGIDPRQLTKKEDRNNDPKNSLKKLRQLCKQVERTLGSVLTGELSDPLLNLLTVVSVQPVGKRSQLLISVAVKSELNMGLNTPNEAEILHALKKVKGYFRSTVAQTISRRRVPALTFRLLAEPGEVKEGFDAN